MTSKQFQNTVWEYYKNHNRNDLPWRKTDTPYHILLSEVMLQQTQVDRVRSYYKAWLQHFPNIQSLAKAGIHEVLPLWQGLGYNRRALNLHKTAQIIATTHAGKIPRTRKELEALPGVGPYTAGAVRIFAWNLEDYILETNIRTAYIHHFFSNHQEKIADKELLPYLEKTVDTKNPREWYWALMDYGAYLKKKIGNKNKQSKSYTKQSPFKGSRREIRGKILQLLIEKPHTKQQLHTYFPKEPRLGTVLDTLLQEGFITYTKGIYEITR